MLAVNMVQQLMDSLAIDLESLALVCWLLLLPSLCSHKSAELNPVFHALCDWYEI